MKNLLLLEALGHSLHQPLLTLEKHTTEKYTSMSLSLNSCSKMQTSLCSLVRTGPLPFYPETQHQITTQPFLSADGSSLHLCVHIVFQLNQDKFFLLHKMSVLASRKIFNKQLKLSFLFPSGTEQCSAIFARCPFVHFCNALFTPQTAKF